MLMDDMLDKKDEEPVGGPHPHAGFETVSLLLEGEIGDEKHTMKAGDFQLMTAGSGIVHTETIDKVTRLRLLQLWVNLPQKDREATPRVQDLPLEHVPTLHQNGVGIRLYSGTLSGLVSPVRNHTPMIIADISLHPGTQTTLTIPANHNTFIYVLDGSVRVSQEDRPLHRDEVGWFDIFESEADSELQLDAADGEARFILYSGLPTHDDIVSYGPFIAGSDADIQRLFRKYREGKMQHIAEVADEQRIML
jgi:redox-sensitive bicupin YhaK (pirin superfamily)